MILKPHVYKQIKQIIFQSLWRIQLETQDKEKGLVLKIRKKTFSNFQFS